ncbi:hypothetical protein ACROYT_G041904 [Oculina patagonica]
MEKSLDQSTSGRDLQDDMRHQEKKFERDLEIIIEDSRHAKPETRSERLLESPAFALTKPGDCIVFHMKTVHGAHGNNLSTPRRSFSTRWLGNDAVKGKRPWVNLPPSSEIEGLKQGDKLLDSGAFPVVWTSE